MRFSGHFVVLYVVALLSAIPARAGFVIGTEHFDGTQLDTSTWEFFTSNPGRAQALQNDHLTLSGANGQFSDADYTTLQKRVHRGQSLRVDAVFDDSVAPDMGSFSLFLTDNSEGQSGLTVFDSQTVEFRVRQSGPAIGFRGGNGSASGTLLKRANGELFIGPSLNIPVTYEIDYLSSTSARFAALDSSGALLGDSTLHFNDPLPQDMAISLAIRSGTAATFDNVTISAVAIPLPSACMPGACVMLLIVSARMQKKRKAAS